MRRMRLLALGGTLLLAGCAARGPESQAYFGGQPVDLRELSADEVARAVQITPRADDVLFQAPPVQISKVIDLQQAGKEMGLQLGHVERVRYGYLFGVRNRLTGVTTHYILFQSNFVTGSDRYTSVSLPDGQPLQFTVSRPEDPCVPNCFPVIEALIVEIPEDVLRANRASGLPLTITLDNGETIKTKGMPPYVQGYLQAVDGYRG